MRAKAESVASFYPAWIAAWRKTADALEAPIDLNAKDVLDTVTRVEQELRDELPRERASRRNTLSGA
jgi:hypothetical protein